MACTAPGGVRPAAPPVATGVLPRPLRPAPRPPVWGRTAGLQRCRVLQGGRSSADGAAGKQQAHSAGREVARAGLLALLKALAATKLAQASALRAVATSVQAMAPAVVDLTRGSKWRSPGASGSDGESASPSPPPPTAHSHLLGAAPLPQSEQQQVAPPVAPAVSLQQREPAQNPSATTLLPTAPAAATSNLPAAPPLHDATALPVAPTATSAPTSMPPPAPVPTAPPPSVPQAAANLYTQPPHGQQHFYAPAAPPPTAAAATPSQQQHAPPPFPQPPQQPQQPAWRTVLVPDAQAAAALWAEELRHMQTRRRQLAEDVADLLATHRNPTNAQTTPTTPAAPTDRHHWGSMGSQDGGAALAVDGLFVDAGPEFCPLTCQVETAVEVKQAREAVWQQIAALSERCYWVPQGAEGTAAAAAAAASAGGGGTRELQRAWEAASSEVTYLMVRLVVLQQLPAQPKQRPTVRHVKHEVLTHLHARLAKLLATHHHHGSHPTHGQAAPPQAAAVPLPTASSPFLPQDASVWHVDAPALQTISDHHIPL